MSDQHERSQDRFFTDLEARQLIERATDLDAQGAWPHNLEDIRRIAAEAGISGAAFERALEELGPTWEADSRLPVTESPPSRPAGAGVGWWKRIARAVGAAVVGGMLGGAAIALRAPVAGAGIVALSAAIIGALLFHHRQSRSPVAYQVELLILGVSFVLGADVTSGGLPIQSFIVPTGTWLVAAVLGAVLVPSGRRADHDGLELAVPAGSPVRGDVGSPRPA